MAFHALIARLTDNLCAASDAGLRCDAFEFGRRHDLEGWIGCNGRQEIARGHGLQRGWRLVGTPGERSDCVPATGAVCERVQAHRKTSPPPTPRVALEQGADSAGVFCYAADRAGDHA
jgi:hypothetical protein